MGHPALELKAAGFEIGLLDDGRVLVKPASRLTEETCQFIKAHKQELVDYLRRQAVNDTTASPAPAVDWHQADRAYQAHHWTCPQCRAAGLGYGQGCAEGQALWDSYEALPMPEFGKTKRVTPAPLLPAPQTPQPRMTPRSEPEIVRMIGLHRRALAVGLPNNSATGKVLDELMDTPDMGSCFACNHLRGTEPERWRCAGHGHELSGSPLPRELVVHLHRCAGYESPPVI